jgi:WhiB family redox-sensing transcriptional regulator
VVGQLPAALAAGGACRTAADPDLWFADDLQDQAAAVAVCRACPVRALCGAWALDTGQLYGIWGGLTEAERRQGQRGQRAAS